MKQTAVEWLVEQYTQGNYSWEVYEHAKEMEKKQTIEFAYNFYDNFFIKDGVIQKSAGEYYNETYGDDT